MTFPSNQLGLELQVRGIERVSRSNSEWIAHAKDVARRVAHERGSVSSDDIHELCPPPPGAHPNVMGAVFKGIGLRVISFMTTKRPSGHGRLIRVYGP
jgi:hypothetical protein